jgi:hypothetical protein
MSLAKHEFTDAGRSMLGRAQAGEVLTLTKIVVGSGSAAIPDDLWPLTALITHQMDVTISGQNDFGNGILMVEGSFLSNTAPASFFLREVGVMAHIGAEADQLYSVANVFADPADLIDPASPSLQAFKIKLVIDRIPAANLIIQIGPSENVIGQNLATDTIGPGVYKDAAGNVLSFKRLAAGAGIELIEDAGLTYITIAQKQLKVNVDLYVPASHPACPTPEQGFPTIQAAHDYLKQFVIPTNLTATIHVYSGTFAHTAQINLDHPNAKQITLIGEPRVDKTVTVINYVDATHKNVAVSNLTGLAVGQRVYLALCAAGWSGGAKITALGGSVVTLSVEKRDTRPTYTTQDAAAGRRLSYYPTVLTLTEATKNVPVLNCPYGIGRIKNFTIDAGGSHGIGMLANGAIENCSVWNAKRGFHCDSGTSYLWGENVATQCDFGIVGAGNFFALDQTYINACGAGIAPASDSGVAAQTGGMDNSVAWIAHCAHGIRAWAGSNFLGGRMFVSSNDIFVYTNSNGVATINPGGYQSYLDNNGTDLLAVGSSYINYNRNAGGAPTCNPAANTEGNQNSYIYVVA